MRQKASSQCCPIRPTVHAVSLTIPVSVHQASYRLAMCIKSASANIRYLLAVPKQDLVCAF